MPGDDDLHQFDIEQASAQLNQGLKSCRAVVQDYRAMLGGSPDPLEAGDGNGRSTEINSNDL